MINSYSTLDTRTAYHTGLNNFQNPLQRSDQKQPTSSVLGSKAGGPPQQRSNVSKFAEKLAFFQNIANDQPAQKTLSLQRVQINNPSLNKSSQTTYLNRSIPKQLSQGKIRTSNQTPSSAVSATSAASISPNTKQAAMPADSFDVLFKWLTQAEKHSPYFKNGISKGAREDYPRTGDELKKSFNEFAETFKAHSCNFHKMKSAYQNGGSPAVDKQKMQMLCDLRAAFYEHKYFPKVVEWVKNNHNLEMQDPSAGSTGSVEVTSDWDPPFKVGENHQTIEAKAVAHFNEIFRKEWGAEAGLVFDTNAYTNQYDRKVENFELQSQLGRVQNTISLVMSSMTLPSHDFDQLTDQIAGKITNSSEKTAFTKKIAVVKDERDQLTGRLNKEMLSTALKMGITLPNEIKKAYTANAEKDNNKWCLDRHVVDFFDNMEKTNHAEKTDTFEQIKRMSKNNIHEDIKGSYTTTENRRSELLKTSQDLIQITDPNLFMDKFNEQVLKQIDHIKNSSSPDQALIDHLEDHMILDGEASTVMNTFQDLKGIEATLKAKTQERAGLEEISTKINLTSVKLARFNAALQSTNGTTMHDLQRMLAQKNILQTNLAELEKAHGQNGETLKSKKAALDEELSSLRKSHEALRTTSLHGQVAKILDNETDRLMVEMEKIQTKGMIFADEAHASADAFKRVVLGIQVGLGTVHSIQAELNAVTEIASFAFGHMHHHAHSGESMMANGAKYVDRIFTVLDIVNERANALQLPPPSFSPDTQVEGMRNFFTKLAPNRAKGGEELKNITKDLATESGFISKDSNFTLEIAKDLDRQLKDLCSTLLAWGQDIPSDKSSVIF
jgi:hypothetical protein